MKRVHAMFVHVMFCHANACTVCRTRTVATNSWVQNVSRFFAIVSWPPLARLCPFNSKRAQQDLWCDCRTMYSLTTRVVDRATWGSISCFFLLYSPFSCSWDIWSFLGLLPINRPASRPANQPASLPAKRVIGLFYSLWPFSTLFRPLQVFLGLIFSFWASLGDSWPSGLFWNTFCLVLSLTQHFDYLLEIINPFGNQAESKLWSLFLCKWGRVEEKA